MAMSLLCALFPLVGLVVLAAMGGRYALARSKVGNPLPWSSWAWAAPSFIVLALMAAGGSMGLLEGAFLPLVAPITCALVVGGGLVTLRRDEVWRWFDRQDHARRRRLVGGLVLLVLVLALLVVEVPYNAWMPLGGPTYFWLEMLLCGLLLLALYLLGQRHAGLCCVGIAFFFVTGIGQHFVKRLKNAAILPTDLLVLDTAAAVTGEYVFTCNEQALAGVCMAMLAVCALSLVRPPHYLPQTGKVTSDASDDAARHQEAGRGQCSSPSTGRARITVLNLVGAGASSALLALLVLAPSYQAVFGVQMQYWYSIDYYQMQGFYPTFIAVLQDMPIARPAGYSDEDAEAVLAAHAHAWREQAQHDPEREAAVAQFDELRPSVVVVMNESFADLSTYDGMHAGYQGPQFFKHGFDDALVRGTLNVSVLGGGTCNSEFEFLTSNSMSFIGMGKYPYSIYDLSDVYALPRQFKQCGYVTTAIHPNYPSNWNRDTIYPDMGFDSFLTIDDFGGTPDPLLDRVTPNEPHCEVFHSGVSDSETYDRILALLEQDERPQFVFDVTMANHGSYDQGNIPAAYQTHYYPTGFEGTETPERLNEYLSCVQRSDDDLREFVDKLRALDRPVVLVFFGDHQPSVSVEYNDYWYPNEPEGVHARRAYSTAYVVWANYNVAGRDQRGEQDETSVDMLAAQMVDIMGAPVTDFQAAQLDIRSHIPSLSVSEYQGADRMWYAPDAECPFQQAYYDLSLMEYLNFARKV